jgi:hypothetical protein
MVAMDTSSLLSVTGNKGNGGVLFEQFHRGHHLTWPETELIGNLDDVLLIHMLSPVAVFSPVHAKA